jgi:nitrogen-specific signal transduction histidine kinase
VQQLGGVIRLESEPGRTAFQIMLPARTGAENATSVSVS